MKNHLVLVTNYRVTVLVDRRVDFEAYDARRNLVYGLVTSGVLEVMAGIVGQHLSSKAQTSSSGEHVVRFVSTTRMAVSHHFAHLWGW